MPRSCSGLKSDGGVDDVDDVDDEDDRDKDDEDDGGEDGDSGKARLLVSFRCNARW